MGIELYRDREREYHNKNKGYPREHLFKECEKGALSLGMK